MRHGPTAGTARLKLEGSTAAILRDATAPIITLHDSPWYSSTLIPGIVTTHRNWPDGLFPPARAAFHRQRLLDALQANHVVGPRAYGRPRRAPPARPRHIAHAARCSLELRPRCRPRSALGAAAALRSRGTPLPSGWPNALCCPRRGARCAGRPSVSHWLRRACRSCVTGRCHPFFLDFSECMSKASDPSE